MSAIIRETTGRFERDTMTSMTAQEEFVREGRQLISVVVPCYNEEEVVRHTHERLAGVLSAHAPDHEIIYVDDGSSDQTALLLREIQAVDARVGVVRLSRNFGHQVAVTAGIEYAKGDAIVIIDADLQDPPEVIPEMVAAWRKGFDIVYGVRNSREGETSFKLWSAKLFYRIINALSEVPLPLDAGDFRLIDRAAAAALRQMQERHRLLRAMTSWVGFKQTAIPYEREKRFAGVTKYPLRKMILLALDGIVSFSTVPLRVVTFIGLVLSVLSVVGIIYALVSRLLTDIWVPGWTLLFISSLMLGGLQLVFLGVIGEYVGRIYGEVKQRPLFIVMETLGTDEFRRRCTERTQKANQA